MFDVSVALHAGLAGEVLRIWPEHWLDDVPH